MGVILLGQIECVHWEDLHLISALAEVGSYPRTSRMGKCCGGLLCEEHLRALVFTHLGLGGRVAS